MRRLEQLTLMHPSLLGQRQQHSSSSGRSVWRRAFHSDGPGVTLTWNHNGLHPLTQAERHLGTTDDRFFVIVTDLVAPRELIDESGDIAWRARSTLWGPTTWTRDATAYTPLRFPGQYFDPETGLHHNYFRTYDPETARYLTPDPLGLAPAPNPARYVHNPHTWADPLGHSPEGCPDRDFYTVQSPADASRLTSGGELWPDDATRGQYGHGVYSWGTIEDARIYADVRLGQGVNVEIVPFRVSAEDFLGLKKAEIVSMSPEDAERFMEAHSRICGEDFPHDYD
ncbi:hypothetical protein Sxan_04190 [Streptomyces xanthophaeus]|uniref:RHS repeat-associated core domain-containing protein n=1 Tax=Streptomyces xanthophaeus TaxID=67385 RepID=A0A919GSB7_9ACTN|nr:hypothetical protein Sxan_04190 [Streptomyces xanthophaeus]